MVESIFEFIGLVFNILMNRYVFAYVVLPGIVVAGIVKYCKNHSKSFLKPILKFLAIYYVARTIVVIFF